MNEEQHVEAEIVRSPSAASLARVANAMTDHIVSTTEERRQAAKRHDENIDRELRLLDVVRKRDEEIAELKARTATLQEAELRLKLEQQKLERGSRDLTTLVNAFIAVAPTVGNVVSDIFQAKANWHNLQHASFAEAMWVAFGQFYNAMQKNPDLWHAMMVAAPREVALMIRVLGEYDAVRPKRGSTAEPHGSNGSASAPPPEEPTPPSP